MHASWRAGIWLWLLLSAFASKAPGVNADDERSNVPETGLRILKLAANRSSVEFQLNCPDCPGFSERGLIFDLVVIPSDRVCDVSAVSINGQALFDFAPESSGSSHLPYSSLNISRSTDHGHYHLTASWYMACIMEGGAHTLNRLIVNVDQFEGKVVGNVGFNAQIIQGTEPMIYRVTPGDSGQKVAEGAEAPRLSKGLVGNSNLPKLLGQVEELRTIKDSIKELKCEMKHKKREYKERKRHIKKLLKTEYRRLKKEIKNCNGFGCAAEAFLHEVRDAIRVAQHYRHHYDKKPGKHSKGHEGHQMAEFEEGQARPWHPPRPLLKDGLRKNSSPTTTRNQSGHHHRHRKHHGGRILKILGGIFLLLFVATSIRRHRCKGGLHRNRRRCTCWDQTIEASYSPWRSWIHRRVYSWGRHPCSYHEKLALILKLGEILEDATDAVSDIARAEEGHPPTAATSTGAPPSTTAELTSQPSPQLTEPPQYEIYDGAEVHGHVVDGLQYTPGGTEYTPGGTEYTPSDTSSVRSVEVDYSKS